jgi:hypothetical protein
MKPSKALHFDVLRILKTWKFRAVGFLLIPDACRWRPGKEWRFRSKKRWRANPARRSSSVKLSTTVSSQNWKKKASSTGSTGNDPRGANASSATGFKDRSFPVRRFRSVQDFSPSAPVKLTLIGCARIGCDPIRRVGPPRFSLFLRSVHQCVSWHTAVLAFRRRPRNEREKKKDVSFSSSRGG